MIKGLAGGVLAGTAAAVLALAVLSQLSAPPVPFAPEASPGPAVAIAPAPVSPAPVAEVAVPAPVAEAPVPPAVLAQTPAAPTADAPLPADAEPVAAAEQPPPKAIAAEPPAASVASAPVAPAAPVPDVPAVVAAPAEPPATEPAAPAALPQVADAQDGLPSAPAAVTAEATAPPALPTLPGAPAAPAPAVATGVTAPPAGPGPVVQDAPPAVASLTDPAASAVEPPGATVTPVEVPTESGATTTAAAADLPPGAQPAPDLPVPAEPAPEVAQGAEPAPGLLNRPEPLAPAPGLSDAAGVRVGRLPAIGAVAPAPAEAPAAAIAEDAPPLQRFARVFDNPSGKPLFSVVLIDTGEPGLDRASLASLPFPVTFALDPTLPGADLAATIYRDGGQEVVILVQSLPEGATASDVAVNMEALAGAVPEAVAVMDGEAGGFQSNRVLAGQVVPVVAGQGRAVLSWDRGLNAAAQVARREGVAAATILRRIDAEGESASIMRRYLDRAAFKAVQDGRVVVAGTTRPETVAVLLEWAVEGRATSVTLAPVSAVVRP